MSVSMKAAMDLGVTSYVTTPCRAIDLGHGLLPALEGRSTRVSMGQSIPLAILLAEDNEVNQKVAVRFLEKYEHKIIVVDNGLEALAKARERRYDVILMDVQMPIMGGFEATVLIRQYEQEHGISRTPIIALTAHAMFGDRDKCIAAGMDDYLSKPLNQNQLVQMIAKWTGV
jgi:osomolarity two-component system sensor histidine kinase NIK1